MLGIVHFIRGCVEAVHVLRISGISPYEHKKSAASRGSTLTLLYKIFKAAKYLILHYRHLWRTEQTILCSTLPVAHCLPSPISAIVLFSPHQ
jgi:hypothetical protein